MRSFLNSGFFLAAILLFFLPFVELKCSDGDAFAGMTGFDMAFARGITFTDPEMIEYIQKNDIYKEYHKQPDVFSLFCLLLLLSGIILQFILRKQRPLAALVISGSVLTVLGVFQAFTRYTWNSEMKKMGDIQSLFPVVLEFGIGMWLVMLACLILLVINLFFILQDRKNKYLSVYHPEEGEPAV